MSILHDVLTVVKLKNPFTNKTRWLFFDIRYICGDCGGNGQDCGGTELHHIIGRKSSSPYNAIVLDKNCHSKVGHTDDEQKRFIGKTKKYLDKIGHEPTEKDISFLKTYYD